MGGGVVTPRGIPLISKSVKGVISMDICGKKPSLPPTHPGMNPPDPPFHVQPKPIR